MRRIWIRSAAAALALVVGIGATRNADPENGARLFQGFCAGCHTIGQGPRVGPDLAGITLRREPGWLVRWIRDPAALIATDSAARHLLETWRTPMPGMDLADDEIADVIAYLQETGEGVAPVEADSEGGCMSRRMRARHGMPGPHGQRDHCPHRRPHARP